MITIINEKHSQAEDFAKALGGYTGTLPDDSTLAGQEYNIQFAAGHLYALKDLPDMLKPMDDEDKKRYSSWDYNDLPFDRTQITWGKHLNPHTLGKGASTYMRSIKKALSSSDAAVIATDLDPSGEGNLLGWEIIKGAGFTGPVYRCEHVDQSPTEIRKAFTHLRRVSTDPKSPDRDGLYFKAQAREKFDFLTIQYVRVITDIARKNQVLPPKSIVREGRLKSAMLELIGSQQEKHDNFKPHSDFVVALFDPDNHKFLYKDAKRYNTEEEAQSHLSDAPDSAVIQEDSVQKLSRRPPKMLDLSTAGARLSKKGYDSQEVLDMAEKLYQDKILSYPRTEDSVVTQEQLNALKPLLPDICKAIGVDYNLLDPNGFRKWGIGHGSHGANRPGPSVPASLDELKAQYGDTAAALYNEFARSFLAMFAPDKKLEKHNYSDDKTGNYKASVTVVTDMGWGNVFDDSLSHDDDDDQDKNQDKLYTIGAMLTPGVHEIKASRPSLATENMLMNFLKRNEIGTGATRMQTLTDIKNKKNKTRQMVQESKSKLKLTVLGTISYLDMAGTTLASSKMTKDLEKYLDGIKNNKVKEIQVLRLFDQMFTKDKAQMLKNQDKLKYLTKYKSNKHAKVKGVFKPTGENVEFSDGWSDHKFTQDEIDKLLNGDEIEFAYSKQKGATVTGKLENREKYGFGFNGHINFPKAPMAQGKLKDGTPVSFRRRFGSHDLTDQEVNDVLDGQTISFKSKSRAGKTYMARIKLIYSVPYGSKSKTKTWHLGFADDKKSKFKKSKK